jgi:hypothetical protein
MDACTAITDELVIRLTSIYEEIMWLAERPNTTPSAARAWYTHIASVSLQRQLRRFTGKVSSQALVPNATLRLEHFNRMQTTLTKLVRKHLQTDRNTDEFIRVIVECEQVHIVTVQENYAAMRADGNYDEAKISLVPWQEVPAEMQAYLWKRMLRGRVANHSCFKPLS